MVKIKTIKAILFKAKQASNIHEYYTLKPFELFE